jgi:hypothetical protein
MLSTISYNSVLLISSFNPFRLYEMSYNITHVFIKEQIETSKGYLTHIIMYETHIIRKLSEWYLSLYVF